MPMTWTPRRYAVRSLLGAAGLAGCLGVLALAGCGTSDSAPSEPSTALALPSTTPSSSPPSSVSSTAPALTVTRTGGMAGFDDEWRIASDGALSVASATPATSTPAPSTLKAECVLTEAAHTALLAALDNGTAQPAPTGRSDVMVVTLASPSKTLPLGEAAGSDPASTQVSALIADLDKAPEARTLCRPSR